VSILFWKKKRPPSVWKKILKISGSILGLIIGMLVAAYLIWFRAPSEEMEGVIYRALTQEKIGMAFESPRLFDLVFEVGQSPTREILEYASEEPIFNSLPSFLWADEERRELLESISPSLRGFQIGAGNSEIFLFWIRGRGIDILKPLLSLVSDSIKKVPSMSDVYRYHDTSSSGTVYYFYFSEAGLFVTEDLGLVKRLQKAVQDPGEPSPSLFDGASGTFQFISFTGGRESFRVIVNKFGRQVEGRFKFSRENTEAMTGGLGVVQPGRRALSVPGSEMSVNFYYGKLIRQGELVGLLIPGVEELLGSWSGDISAGIYKGNVYLALGLEPGSTMDKLRDSSRERAGDYYEFRKTGVFEGILLKVMGDMLRAVPWLKGNEKVFWKIIEGDDPWLVFLSNPGAFRENESDLFEKMSGEYLLDRDSLRPVPGVGGIWAYCLYSYPRTKLKLRSTENLDFDFSLSAKRNFLQIPYTGTSGRENRFRILSVKKAVRSPSGPLLVQYENGNLEVMGDKPRVFKNILEFSAESPLLYLTRSGSVRRGKKTLFNAEDYASVKDIFGMGENIVLVYEDRVTVHGKKGLRKLEGEVLSVARSGSSLYLVLRKETMRLLVFTSEWKFLRELEARGPTYSGRGPHIFQLDEGGQSLWHYDLRAGGSAEKLEYPVPIENEASRYLAKGLFVNVRSTKELGEELDEEIDEQDEVYEFLDYDHGHHFLSDGEGKIFIWKDVLLGENLKGNDLVLGRDMIFSWKEAEFGDRIYRYRWLK